MDEDIDLVVNCLKHHDVTDVNALRDSLLTIASLCTGDDAAQNKFREGGGLGYALNLLTSVESSNLMGAVLYALGCATDSNVFTQRRLCSDALFKFLQCQITSPKASAKLKSSAAFFLSCLITNNSTGQNLIRSSGCLDGLLSTLSTLLEDGRAPRELWMGLIKTLCSCVNNPRNDENQLLCGSIFPRVLHWLEESGVPAVIQLISYFISLTVEDNEANQERLGIIGGLEVITSALQDLVESFIRRPNQQIMISLSRLVTTLGIASSDHERNCDKLTELQTIPLLVQILSLDVVTAEVKLKVILTLSSVTQCSEMAQKQLVNGDGLSLLVQTLLENQSDEEMCKAITSVMESCIGWVSALGTENLLYSNTLGLLSGSAVAPQQRKKPCPPPTSGGPNFSLERLKASLEKSSSRPAPMIEDDVDVHRPIRRSVTSGFREDVPGKSSWERSSEPISAKRKLVELLEAPEPGGTSPKLQEETRNRDNVNDDTQSVSYGYGYIQRKLGKLEDKFDKVLKYLSSFRSGAQNTSAKEPPNDAKELASSQPLGQAVDGTSTLQDLWGQMGNQENGSRGAVGGREGRDDMMHGQLRDPPSKDGFPTCGDPSQKGQGVKRTPDPGAARSILPMDVPYVGSNRMLAGVDQPRASAQSHGGDTPLVGAQGDGRRGCTHGSDISRATNLPRGQEVNDSRARGDRESRDGKGFQQDVYCKECCKKCTGGVRESDDDSSYDTFRIQKSSQNEDLSVNAQTTLGKSRSERGGGDITKCALVNVKAAEDVYLDADGDVINDEENDSSDPNLGAKHRAVEVTATRVPPQSTNRKSGMDAGKGSLMEDIQHGPKCPGCNPSALLNSQTFIKTLMSSVHTCSSHKDLVSKVRNRYKARIERLVHKPHPITAAADVYSFSEDERQGAHTDKENTPLVPQRLLDRNRDGKRRPRQDFSQDEICNLIKGVTRHGKHWNTILWSYQFKKGRTGVDLKDKYKRLIKSDTMSAV